LRYFSSADTLSTQHDHRWIQTL